MGQRHFQQIQAIQRLIADDPRQAGGNGGIGRQPDQLPRFGVSEGEQRHETAIDQPAQAIPQRFFRSRDRPAADALIQIIGDEPEQDRMHPGIEVQLDMGQPGLAHALQGQRGRRIVGLVVVFEQILAEPFALGWLRLNLGDGPDQGKVMNAALSITGLIIRQRQIAASPVNTRGNGDGLVKRPVFQGVQGIVVDEILDRTLRR